MGCSTAKLRSARGNAINTDPAFNKLVYFATGTRDRRRAISAAAGSFDFGLGFGSPDEIVPRVKLSLTLSLPFP